MQNFKRLEVWQVAHSLTLRIYAVTARFPQSELYGLTSQLRRSASAVPANIAEGCGRETAADMARFLDIAQGSASEVEYHLLLAHDLTFISDDDYSATCDQLLSARRMLDTLTSRVRVTQNQNPTTRNQRPTTKDSLK